MREFLCIILLLPLLMFCSCNRNGPSVSQLQERLDSLTQQNHELSRTVSALRKDYTRLLDDNEKDFAAFAAGMKQLNDTSDAIRHTMESFAEYKREYRKIARRKAPGTVLGDLPYGSQTFSKAVIREVTDTHIHVQHHNGSARIPLPEAPQHLQAQYGYDPSLDVVLKEATGTGTDWLLSAITSAQHFADSQIPTSTPTVSRPIAAASPRDTPTPAYSTANNSYDSRANERPTWQRFSSFTGSHWAPLHQRKKVVGTVNSVSSRSYGTSYSY